ncbi:Protein of unknown function [Micromonospora lupini str. Lupac 08]|uniref:Uncharacterized protein n=1 Tax=Micromonospora lupini str. Lupac 08 TaxID=1150864 RepID=I0KW48_9ACTN|nr:Protein of unknown function [Micromonospora lupini str. Lupac 08]
MAHWRVGSLGMTCREHRLSKIAKDFEEYFWMAATCGRRIACTPM